jgi:hypothetical protein
MISARSYYRDKKMYEFEKSTFKIWREYMAIGKIK